MIMPSSPGPRPRHSAEAAVLHDAQEIVSALRRCGPEQAFDELLDAAIRHHLAVTQMAQGLIRLLAADLPRIGDAVQGSTEAAHQEWGRFLDRLPGRADRVVPPPAESRSRTSPPTTRPHAV